MNICILGGRGYVGAAISDKLQEDGHDITTLDPRVGGDDHLSLSILSDELEDHLEEYDAVVNLVGLSPVFQPRGQQYRALHVEGVENLVDVCEEHGIDTLVHMSALGADLDAEMEFLRTKGMGEDIVLEADIKDVTVVRPSLIFDHGNHFVEIAKHRAPLRVFPNFSTQVQPIYRQDVAALFAQAVEGGIDEDVLDVGGPDMYSIFEFVEHIYNARGYNCHPLPLERIAKAVLPLFDYVPYSPVGKDQARFLNFDNTVPENDAEKYLDELRSFAEWADEEIGG